MTSEVSILGRTKQLPGQRVRLIEFSERWFCDGSEAEEISAVCAKHYGWGTEPLITLLLNRDFTKKLLKKYKFFYKEFLDETGQYSGVDRRILQRFSILLLSIWVAQKAFRVDMHLDNCKTYLKDFFNKLSAENHEEDKADKLLSDIAGEIARNNGRYPEEIDVRKNRKAYSSQGIDGIKGYNGNIRSVWIIERVFKQMVQKLSSEDLISTCKKLHKKGYLQKFYGNRFHKTKSISIGSPNCYCVLFPDNETAASVISKLNPVDATIKKANATLNNDPLGVDSDFSDLNKQNHPLMHLRFERYGAQQLRITLNNELYKKMKLSINDRVYLLPIPHKGLLMISKKQLTQDCFYTRLHISSTGDAYSAVRKLTEIFKPFNIELDLYDRMICTDIAIEEKEEPIAIINLLNNETTIITSIGDDKNEWNKKFDNNCASFKQKEASRINDLLSNEDDAD